MLVFALKAIGMYFLALIMIRFLGKRALGELGPFDFVVMTGVGDTVISVALDKSIPFYEGMIILATLAILEYLVGYTSLKNQHLSNIISGKPVVLIDNGKIIRRNLAREKFNVDDLMQELRKKGIRDLAKVERGILEACGGFSVILKQSEEPLTCKDLGIEKVQPEQVLTFTNISRAELLHRPDQEPPLEEPAISLPESFQFIREKLEQICNRLDDLEKQNRKE